MSDTSSGSGLGSDIDSAYIFRRRWLFIAYACALRWRFGWPRMNMTATLTGQSSSAPGSADRRKEAESALARAKNAVGRRESEHADLLNFEGVLS